MLVRVVCMVAVAAASTHLAAGQLVGQDLLNEDDNLWKKSVSAPLAAWFIDNYQSQLTCIDSP